MHCKPTFKIIAMTLGILAVCLGSATAAPFKETPADVQLLIESVQVDFVQQHIVITGRNFDNGSMPLVDLAGAPIAVLDYTWEEIVAELPETLSAGDYLLTVTTGSAVKQNDRYALTLGAVGPQGPQGLQGEVGPRGQRGETGPEGPQGRIGLRGPQGATGDQGPPGDDGSDGVSGYLVISETFENLTGVDVHVGSLCPDGKKVLSGSIVSSSGLNIHHDFPKPDGGAWVIHYSAIWFYTHYLPNSFTVRLVCAEVR